MTEIQSGEFAEKPGDYRLVIRPSKPEIAPGEALNLEIYVTGYGTIHNAKVSFYPPQSFVLGPVPSEIAAESAAILTSTEGDFWAASFRNNKDFKDFDTDSILVNMIDSEMGIKKPPLELPLRTRPDIPTGTHGLQFFFTYFNGSEWRTNSQSVSIMVPNWFKRHESWTWGAAIIGVLLALASLLLNTVNTGAMFGFEPLDTIGVIALLCMIFLFVLTRTDILRVGKRS